MKNGDCVVTERGTGFAYWAPDGFWILIDGSARAESVEDFAHIQIIEDVGVNSQQTERLKKHG